MIYIYLTNLNNVEEKLTFGREFSSPLIISNKDKVKVGISLFFPELDFSNFEFRYLARKALDSTSSDFLKKKGWALLIDLFLPSLNAEE